MLISRVRQLWAEIPRGLAAGCGEGNQPPRWAPASGAARHGYGPPQSGKKRCYPPARCIDWSLNNEPEHPPWNDCAHYHFYPLDTSRHYRGRSHQHLDPNGKPVKGAVSELHRLFNYGQCTTDIQQLNTTVIEGGCLGGKYRRHVNHSSTQLQVSTHETGRPSRSSFNAAHADADQCRIQPCPQTTLRDRPGAMAIHAGLSADQPYKRSPGPPDR